MEREYYDEVVQVTCTTEQRQMLTRIAAVRHPRRSRKRDKDIPNVAAAGREAFAEYIMRHREEIMT